MNKLRVMIDNARAAFARLTQREQMIVAGGGAGTVLLLLSTLAWLMSSAMDKAEHRIAVKTEQLQQVLTLQGEYRSRQEERAARMRELGGAHVRLVSLIEETARLSGIEIGQLHPEDGEPSADGIIESRVDLRAAGISADRLQDFLDRIEKSPGVVIVRRLRVNRPYSKDTVEIELTVTTYKMKA